MTSRAYTSFLLVDFAPLPLMVTMCQCPLGLIPHFYIKGYHWFDTEDLDVSMPSRAYTSFLRGITIWKRRVDILVSMPSRAYTSFLPEGASFTIASSMFVSMPSRAYTSFLRYPFKNLGFMRFPEPVFAGIYQNILTTTIFRAC